VAAYLDKTALAALCEQQLLSENDRMLLFNVICLLYWAECYAK
jgi:asparagine synthase (glutamine-hydrolysing)